MYSPNLVVTNSPAVVCPRPLATNCSTHLLRPQLYRQVLTLPPSQQRGANSSRGSRMASSLAPELLLEIFALALDPPASPNHHKNPTSSYPNLLSFSLVARSWTAPAQALLSRHVVLLTARNAEDWLELEAAKDTRAISSVFGGRRTRRRFLRRWESR